MKEDLLPNDIEIISRPKLGALFVFASLGAGPAVHTQAEVRLLQQTAAPGPGEKIQRAHFRCCHPTVSGSHTVRACYQTLCHSSWGPKRGRNVTFQRWFRDWDAWWLSCLLEIRWGISTLRNQFAQSLFWLVTVFIPYPRQV